jgi:hypothetical protein
MTMTYVQLIDRIIAEGLDEVRDTYADPKEHHKRDGAIEGFEACRGQSPQRLVELWREAEQAAHDLMVAHHNDSSVDADAKAYWKTRYKAGQIEWVCNVVSVGLQQNGQPALLAHLPTARGAMKYAMIVGVTDRSRAGGDIPPGVTSP